MKTAVLMVAIQWIFLAVGLRASSFFFGLLSLWVLFSLKEEV